MIIKTCMKKSCPAYGIVLQGKDNYTQGCPSCGRLLIDIPRKMVRRRLILFMNGNVIDMNGTCDIQCEDGQVRRAWIHTYKSAWTENVFYIAYLAKVLPHCVEVFTHKTYDNKNDAFLFLRKECLDCGMGELDAYL